MGTKLIVLAGFLVAFTAGLVSGWQMRPTALVSHPTTGPSMATTRPGNGAGGPRRGGPGGPVRELNLTSEQQEQLNQIWSALAQRDQREREERQQARIDRDNAIIALIPPESHDKYEQLKKNFEDQSSARDNAWRNAYDLAVERTKKILNADQRVRYEQILSRTQSARGRGPGPGRGGFGNPRGRGGPGDSRRDGEENRRAGSATQPSSEH
ncbi:MAG TPA: hypothetical protein VHD56_18860 [Tepidisphaeraceae bacterium]|nr:hypothetical protein [Tepidisphaeraceae bacterium]